MHRHLSKLGPLQEALALANSKLQPRQMNFPSSHERYTQYLMDHISLLNVLAPQLSKLFHASFNVETPIGGLVFSTLWGVLVTSSMSLKLWQTESQGVGHPPTETRLHAALHTTLSLMLRVTRSSLWRNTRPSNFPALLFELSIVMNGPIKCIESLSRAPPRMLSTALASLPATFLPTLCCIAAEQFGGPLSTHRTPETPGATPLSQSGPVKSVTRLAPLYYFSFFLALTQSLIDLIGAADSQSNDRALDSLAHPAIVHALKVSLVIPSPEIDAAIAMYHNAMKCLVCVWQRSDQRASGGGGASLDVALAPTPAKSSDADARLVHTICKRMAAHVRLTNDGYSLLGACIGAARNAESPSDGGARGGASARKKGVPGDFRHSIALRCLSHGLAFMRHQRWERGVVPGSARTAGATSSQVLQQQHKLRSKHAATDPRVVECFLQDGVMGHAAFVMLLLPGPATLYPRTSPNQQGNGSTVFNEELLMPGWAYVLESLTRGAEGYQDYLRLTLPTGRLLCVPGAAALPGSLNACLSLMATLRKLMWSDVKLVPVAQMTPLEQKQLQDEQDRMCLQQMMEMHDREDEEISSVVTSAHSLARALHDFGHGPAEQKPGGPAKNALFLKVFAGTSRAQYDSSRVTALQQQGRVAGRTAGSTSLCQVPTLIERHRVQVVIVLCLVQLAQCWLRWEERSNMARGSGKWLEGLLLLVSFLDKPELIALVTAQLARSPPLLSSTKTSNTRPQSPQEGVGAAWERK
ncbi:MAG: hypothetical protein WDW38_011149 [Sanguina aurantia]